MKIVSGLIIATLLLSACSAEPVARTTFDRLESQTMNLVCPGGDEEVKRYLITKSRTSLGSVSASACGYPNSASTFVAKSGGRFLRCLKAIGRKINSDNAAAIPNTIP